MTVRGFARPAERLARFGRAASRLLGGAFQSQRAPKLGVSVVMPVFFPDLDEHRVALLNDALASIRIQRFPSAYEILLVDDGSPVPLQSLNRALPSLSKKTRFVRLNRNAGIAAALNRGLAEARYPLIARLDADDRWTETKIEKQLLLFENDPDLTIAGTGMTMVDTHGRALETHVRPGSWTWCLDFLKSGGSPFPHGSVVARRDIYQLLGGYPTEPACRFCEDYALWAVWLRFFKPTMVEESLYRYTVSSSSVSVRHRDEQIRGTIRVRDGLEQVVPDDVPRALKDIAEVLGGTLLDAGRLAFGMWRDPSAVMLPPACLDRLAVLMPDRAIRSGADGPPRAFPLPAGDAREAGASTRVAVQALPR